MKLLIEGPVGHMNHPFDLESVKNGQDLLDVFKNQIIQYINKSDSFLSIKIDGINGPIRFIKDEDGNGQFAIDRLSTAPLDLKGVTVDDLRNRFERVNLDLVGTDLEIRPQPIHKLIAKGIRPEQLEPGQVFPIKFKGKMRTAKVLGTTTGHGFVNDGGIALEVLNNAYRKRTKEIESLLDIFGMLNDPNVCLNNDIVHESSKETGKVNVINYDKDFIALHGLNRIYVEEGKKARKTREIIMSPEQKKALEKFVDICNETNTIEGFSVVSPFDLRAQKTESKVDYTEILKVPITLYKDPETPITKTMEQWLQDPNILKPKYGNVYQFADGKKRDAFSKDVYVSLIPPSGNALSVKQILDPSTEINDKVFYDFASGAIFYHATRLLGNEVLKTLVNTTDIGGKQITDHEGIVMRDADLFGTDDEGNATIVKVTGDFILSGMRGGISQAMSKEKDQKPIQEKISIRISKDKEITKTSMDWLKEISNVKVKYIKLDKELYNDIIIGEPIVELVPQSMAESAIYSAVIDQLNVLCEEDEEGELKPESELKEAEKRVVAIIPGAFKPPHSGHSDMISKYATGEMLPTIPKADKVVILISKPTKAGRFMTVDNKPIEIRQHHSEKMWNEIFLPILKEESPEVDFELVTDTPFASSFAAALEYIGPRGPLEPENDKVILGASKKADRKTNLPDWKRWDNLNPKYIKPGLEIFNPENSAVECTARACGTDFSATDFREALGDFLTDPDNLKAKTALMEFIPKDKLNTLFKIFGDVVKIDDLDLQQNEYDETALDEFSGVGMGAIAGFAGNIDDEIVRREQKENEDEMIIREVMKLIMERGILQ